MLVMFHFVQDIRSSRLRASSCERRDPRTVPIHYTVSSHTGTIFNALHVLLLSSAFYRIYRELDFPREKWNMLNWIQLFLENGQEKEKKFEHMKNTVFSLLYERFCYVFLLKQIHSSSDWLGLQVETIHSWVHTSCGWYRCIPKGTLTRIKACRLKCCVRFVCKLSLNFCIWKITCKISHFM